jgi:CTP:molybdopterin cytidylyltransferase MocA
MGQPKALLPIDSGPGSRTETFLGRVVGTLRTAGVDDVLVVVGHDAELIRGVVLEMPNPPRLVYNPDAAQGQLSSILAALRVVDHPGVEAILLTLVDVPLVSAETVRRLLTAYRRSRAHIVRPVRGDRHGHPVVFDRAVFDDLRHADPAIGAKAVLRAHADRVLDLPVDDHGAFADIDTPADYERIIGRPMPGPGE